MTPRRGLFNFAAAISLLLGITAIFAWHQQIQSHLPELHRILQKQDELRRAIEREPPGTAVHKQLADDLMEVEMRLRQQLLAEYEDELPLRNATGQQSAHKKARSQFAVLQRFKHRYAELPTGIVVALLLLPAGWVIARIRAWRRPTSRVAIALSRWQTIRQFAARLAVILCCVLAIGAAMLIPRSYYLLGDGLFFSTWFDRDELAFWRITNIRTGRGQIGFNVIVQSGPKETYRDSNERSYQQRWGMGTDDIPRYSAFPPVRIDFQFGPETKRWGCTWSSFEHAQNGLKPTSWGYEAIAPIWMLEIPLLPLPLLWLGLWVRRRRRDRAGHCVGCGYNLTGNTSGTCPECGTAIAISQSAGHVNHETTQR